MSTRAHYSVYSMSTILDIDFASIYERDNYYCEERDTVEYLFETPVEGVQLNRNMFEVGSYAHRLHEVITHFRNPKLVIAKDDEKPTPLTPQEKFWLSRECALRFLRATKWNVKTAIERITETLIWRRNIFPKIDHYALQIYTQFESGTVIFSGFDDCGRPCVQINLNRIRSRSDVPELQLAGAVFYLETVLQYIPQSQETVCVLLDFNDKFHTEQIDPAKIMHVLGIAKRLIGTFERYYPERLGQVYVSNVPWYGWTFINVLKLMDLVSRKKIVVKERAEDHVPREQLHQNWGGQLTYLYNHYVYWPRFVQQANAKQMYYYDRFCELGGVVGISEFDTKGSGDAVYPVYIPEEEDTSSFLHTEMAAKNAGGASYAGETIDSVSDKASGSDAVNRLEEDVEIEERPIVVISKSSQNMLTKWDEAMNANTGNEGQNVTVEQTINDESGRDGVVKPEALTKDQKTVESKPQVPSKDVQNYNPRVLENKETVDKSANLPTGHENENGCLFRKGSSKPNFLRRIGSTISRTDKSRKNGAQAEKGKEEEVRKETKTPVKVGSTGIEAKEVSVPVSIQGDAVTSQITELDTDTKHAAETATNSIPVEATETNSEEQPVEKTETNSKEQPVEENATNSREESAKPIVTNFQEQHAEENGTNFQQKPVETVPNFQKPVNETVSDMPKASDLEVVTPVISPSDSPKTSPSRSGSLASTAAPLTLATAEDIEGQKMS